MELLLWLQQVRSPALDVVCKVLTTMGEDVFVVAVLCCFLWCYNKDFAYKIGFAFCGGMWMNQMLKVTFCVPRPWVLDSRIVPHQGALETATGFSFPSGHTQSGVSLFGSIALYVRRWWTWALCVLLMLGVGFSRLYFGVHTVYDVGASLVLGMVSVAATFWLVERWRNRPGRLALVYLAGCAVLLLYALLKPYPAGTTPGMADDCYKMVGAMAGFVIGWFLEQRYVNFSVKASAGRQVGKVVLGLISLAALKLLCGQLPQGAVWLIAENGVLVLWAVLLYPLLFRRLFT